MGRSAIVPKRIAPRDNDLAPDFRRKEIRTNLSQRQFDSENRAFRAVPVVDLYLTVMRLNDCAHDGETHAHSVILGGKEWVEDPFRGFLGYTRPCVGHRDFGELPVSPRFHCNRFLCLFRSAVASNPFRIKLERTCCNWTGSPLIRRGAPFSLLCKTISRDLASGDKNLTVSATSFVDFNSLSFEKEPSS